MIYTLPSNIHNVDFRLIEAEVDATVDTILLSSRNTYSQPLHFIGVRNCEITVDGPVNISVSKDLSYALKFDDCKNFWLTGVNKRLKLSGGNIGIAIEKRSTDFEIEHVEVSDCGFAGVMAKDDSAKRTDADPFVMRNVKIHHCKIERTGGEGLYIGNSSYLKGHDLENVELYSNTFKDTGWDSIQLGNCIKGASIHDNTIDNYGTKNERFQNNAIQLGEGTGGLCFRNIIRKGTGNGIIVLGLGDNNVYDNVILNAGENGIYCDDRVTPGPGFKFIGNIIVSPRVDCIGIFANKGLLNEARNNQLVLPGSFGVMPTRDSFLNKGADVLVKDVNNLRSRDEQLAGFLLAKFGT